MKRAAGTVLLVLGAFGLACCVGLLVVAYSWRGEPLGIDVE